MNEDKTMDCFSLGKSVAYEVLKGRGEHVPDVAHAVGWELSELAQCGYSEEELEAYAAIRARIIEREEINNTPQAIQAQVEAEAAAAEAALEAEQ